MSALERVGVAATGLLPLVVLLALALRRRLGRCWLFPAYLVSVAGFNLVVAGWPQRFFDWSTWLAADMVQGLLVLGVATEITLRAFASLPRGRQTARVALLACLAVALALVWSADTKPLASWPDLARELVPRLSTSRTVAFLSLFGVALYHELPLDDLHDAIVRGLALYSALTAVGLVAVGESGWQARGAVSTILTAGYMLLLVYWAHAAWRRESDVPATVTRRLWPWRS